MAKHKQEHIKIRVLCGIPVRQGLEPVVGKVYDAIRGNVGKSKARQDEEKFCVIEVAGKKIVLRNGYRQEPEYEVIENVG